MSKDMVNTSKIIRDAWVFGNILASATSEGWDPARDIADEA